ncbi:Aldehyde Dehydrogenase [Planctopirus limnophila DSM 3776]|uniref:Aldehyde Dehydrogenase n=1 Tax=Planctopirus limnophila (strain ATCC 43296 / DSM 3776 / IFAM 1008 / Mu 290) TaxID=521674 RepID=D5SR71_PLAL2|nr:aldehyde dehydrogenase family protein [Planctopirus limnophila]ADG68564.1 Aldehyde Dehydrogenase [Planctopirus limnophila DSM 3776]
MALTDVMPQLRHAQQEWSRRSIAEKARIFRRFRHLLVSSQQEIIDTITIPQRQSLETLTAEILPLAEACQFLERVAGRALSPKKLSRRGQPLWMPGAKVWELRQPHGIVLVVGPSNYPLFLPGVQVLQGLMAGNGIILKPGRLAQPVSDLLKRLLVEAGLPEDLMYVTGESHAEVAEVLAQRPDFVVMTGSVGGGQAVLKLASEQLIPGTFELSGRDAMYLLPDASFQLAAQCLAFGLMINGGATCMAPRKVYCPLGRLNELVNLFQQEVGHRGGSCAVDRVHAEPAIQTLEQTVAQGGQVLAGSWSLEEDWQPVLLGNLAADAAVLHSDLFVPVATVFEYQSIEELLAEDRKSDYALSASIFGNTEKAMHLARQLSTGCVVINDLIAPTADPRVAFGGNRWSGYGRTRGIPGLMEMTTLQVIVSPRGRWKPHLGVKVSENLLSGLARWCHGAGATAREGLWQMLKNLWSR